ncbi:MAG: hypothetical protein KF745_00410 [Phycisphaeraceae bacterium]|nr:hypothetical protein [Phycisphaeraceae bacterium]
MLNLPSSFNPSPDLAAKILDSVTDPTLTLRDVADLHHTSVEALVLWFAEPEIAERLDHIESTIARRTRIVASNFLPAATIALGRSIDEHNSDESHFPVRPGDQRGLELRRRSRETARRATALLLRLANFTPGPRRYIYTPRPTPAPSSTPIPTSPAPSVSSSAPDAPVPCSSTSPASSPSSSPSARDPQPLHDSPHPTAAPTPLPARRGAAPHSPEPTFASPPRRSTSLLAPAIDST